MFISKIGTRPTSPTSPTPWESVPYADGSDGIGDAYEPLPPLPRRRRIHRSYPMHSPLFRLSRRPMGACLRVVFPMRPPRSRLWTPNRLLTSHKRVIIPGPPTWSHAMIGPYDKIMTRLTSRLGAIGKGGNGRYRLRGRHGRKWMRVVVACFRLWILTLRWVGGWRGIPGEKST
jgi:hypothetical protein